MRFSHQRKTLSDAEAGTSCPLEQMGICPMKNLLTRRKKERKEKVNDTCDTCTVSLPPPPGFTDFCTTNNFGRATCV